MSRNVRKFNYYLYHITLSLFILLVALFLFLDYSTGEVENGSSLKYIIVFLAFGTFLAGSAFFNRKLCEGYHPLSLLYVLAGLIIIFMGSRALTNYLNPETENIINLKIPLYILIVIEAVYVYFIYKESLVSLIINAIVAILGIICAFVNINDEDMIFRLGFLILTIISVIIATIRAIKGSETEIENSFLELLTW